MKNSLLAPLLLALSLLTSSLQTERPIAYHYTQEVALGDYILTLPAEFDPYERFLVSSASKTFRDDENGIELFISFVPWFDYLDSDEQLDMCNSFASHKPYDTDTCEFIQADGCMSVLVCSDEAKIVAMTVVNRYDCLFMRISFTDNAPSVDASHLRALGHGILERIVAPEQPLKEAP